MIEILHNLSIPFAHCARPTHKVRRPPLVYAAKKQTHQLLETKRKKMGWFNRPHLAQDQVKYALESVVHLIEAYDAMQGTLQHNRPHSRIPNSTYTN